MEVLYQERRQEQHRRHKNPYIGRRGRGGEWEESRES